MSTLIQDRPTQPHLLAHHTPRIGKNAFGTGSHTLDVELFKHYGAKAFAKIPLNPMVPILADPPVMDLYGRDTASLFGVSDGPAFSASKHTLSFLYLRSSMARLDGRVSISPVDKANVSATPQSIPTCAGRRVAGALCSIARLKLIYQPLCN